MATNPQNFNESDRETRKEILSYENQLLNLMKERAKLERTSSDSYLKQEKNLLNIIDSQKKSLDNQKDLLEIYQKQYNSTRTLYGVDSEEAKDALLSIKQKMSFFNDEFAYLSLKHQQEQYNLNEKIKKEKTLESIIRNVGGNTLSFLSKEYDSLNNLYNSLSTFDSFTKDALIRTTIYSTILKVAIGVFEQFDNAAAKFRMTMGATRPILKDIRNNAENLAINFAHVGVNIDGVYNAYLALQDQVGSLFGVTKDLVKTTSIFSAQLGVAENVSSGVMHSLAAVSRTTMQIQRNTLYIAANMSAAAGVQLNEVMQDINDRSKETLTLMSRFPLTIIKTAIEARRLNSTLHEMAQSSRHILDFNSSVDDEMAASVLLGQNVNMQRARELAYRRDLLGSTKEIIKLTNQVNFENLDVFQQEAFAKATGKSVDELLRLVVAERQWNAVRNDPRLGKRIREYEALAAANESTLRTNAANYELELQRRENQARIVSLQNKWNEVMIKMSEIFLPIIDLMLSAVIPVLDIFTGLSGWTMALSKSANILGTIGGYVATLGGNFFNIGATLTDIAKIFSVFDPITKFLIKGFSIISKIIPFVAKFGGLFTTWLPVIGQVIMGLQFISKLFSHFGEVLDAYRQGGLWEAIKTGIRAVFQSLYDVLIQPFVDVYNWVMDKLGGHSPSEIGLAIVKGLTSVSGMIFDALTSPFRNALSWILNWIPGMNSISDKIYKGISGMVGNGIERDSFNTITPVLNVTPNDVDINGNSNKSDIKQTIKEDSQNSTQTNKLLVDILTSLHELNDNLKSGKFGLYMDGQLLSSTLSRQTSFRKGYGVNSV